MPLKWGHMLDQEAVNVARRMIKAQIGERQEDPRLEASRVHSEMAKRGIGRSTIAVREVHNLCAHEIENWAWIVWRVLHRAICTVGVQPSNTLAKDLKDEVLEHVQPVV